MQRLELVEPFAEGLALFHVGQRFFQRRLRAAERAGRDIEPAAVEAGHRDLETEAFLAEPVCRRHARVLERRRARVGCAFQPILRSLAPNEMPAVSPGTMKAEMPDAPSPPVRAITT